MKRSEIYLQAAVIVRDGLLSQVIEGKSDNPNCGIYCCWALEALTKGKFKGRDLLRINMSDYPEFSALRPATACGNLWFDPDDKDVKQKRFDLLMRAHEIAKSNGN